MRGPDVIKSVTASFVKLSEKEWLVALRVKHDIERARDRAFQPGVKAGPGAGRQPFSENAQSVAGVKLSRRGIPLCTNGCIRLSRKIRGAKLVKKFGWSIVRESQITVNEFLIKDGSA